MLEFINEVLAASVVTDPEAARELLDAMADTWEVNGTGALSLLVPPAVFALLRAGTPGIVDPAPVLDDEGVVLPPAGPCGSYRGIGVLLDPAAAVIGAVVSR